MNGRILLSPPHLSGSEMRQLESVLESNWLAPAGPHLQRFEQAMADRVGVPRALAVASGTAALHLILRHLGLRPGDQVICSTLTFCASANPICYEGASPVFIDSDEATWNLDPNLLEDELTACARRNRLPRAIIAVDIFGQSADMDAIGDVAARYEIPVIEDAAEALGSTYKGRATGSSSWASFFSFNGNKMITTTGGGMICSADQELIEHAEFLATQARDPASYYQHSTIGFNYRMSNMLAAVGLAQLETLEQRVAARRSHFSFYQQTLSALPGVRFMPEAAYGRSNRWLSVLSVDPWKFGCDCEQLRAALEQANIESRRVWKPLHLQPVYAGCRYRSRGVAERLFESGLCLPSGSGLTDDDRQRVVDAVRAAGQHVDRAKAA